MPSKYRWAVDSGSKMEQFRHLWRGWGSDDVHEGQRKLCQEPWDLTELGKHQTPSGCTLIKITVPEGFGFRQKEKSWSWASGDIQQAL